MRKQTIRKKRKLAYLKSRKKRFFEFICREMVKRIFERMEQAILYGETE